MIFSYLSRSLALFSRSIDLLRLQLTSVFREMSVMEAQWVAQRSALRWLVRLHPEWTQALSLTLFGKEGTRKEPEIV